MEIKYLIKFILSLIYDLKNIKNNRYYEEIKLLQVDISKPIFLDRLDEISFFYSKNVFSHIKYFIKNGSPNGDNFVDKLHDFFEKDGECIDNSRLEKAYEKSSLHYVYRLMLAYERYSDILPLLKYIQNNKNLNDVRVLDYGCGVSDLGLICSNMGCIVDILDLDKNKLDFAICRYQKRHYNVNAYTPDNVSDMIASNKKYDLIIASELLEHVPCPMEILHNTCSLLDEGGIFYETLGPIYKFKKAHGDHIKSAEKAIRTEEFYNYHISNFYPLGIKDYTLRYAYRIITDDEKNKLLCNI